MLRLYSPWLPAAVTAIALLLYVTINGAMCANITLVMAGMGYVPQILPMIPNMYMNIGTNLHELEYCTKLK